MAAETKNPQDDIKAGKDKVFKSSEGAFCTPDLQEVSQEL